ncbi:MAG: glycosyltransferase [Pseudorhodoplanes sp.]|jgi:glycosyltransferase involved in cell wall biosynthesis|nr:glycosyltransferase [Pseudorhodoplanes sp.]
MKTIIHISADFPDPLVPGKTRAVANLLTASPGFRHVVYSLNRVPWHRGVALTHFGDGHAAITYGAPPYGLGLARFLKPVAGAIAQDLQKRGIAPDLIHGHKFSVEGLVAADVAENARRPFICSLWGDTDIKIFEYKPGLRRRYREIAANAELMLPAAPWTADYFSRVLNQPKDKMPVLPVITAGDKVIRPEPSYSPRLVSVFHLDSWKRKGLDILAKAAVEAAGDIPGLTLDIYGTGRDASINAVSEILRRAGAIKIVRLMGQAPHNQVQHLMNGYTAFVMAPRRETYGMVHVEAVLAGLPILWSQDRGIDGLFGDHPIGYRANPESVEDVARGLRFLVANERPLKATIARLQQEGAFEHLRSPAIAAQYCSLLAGVAA